MPDTTDINPTPTPTDAPAAAPAPAEAPQTAESMPQPNIEMAPAYQPGSTVSSATGQIAAPMPAEPPKHARLLAMISALATGMGAAGTSLATHGREGGVQEVEQVQTEEANRKARAQEVATAQRSAQIQQQMMLADTTLKQMQIAQFHATSPDDIAKSRLEVKGLAQTQAITGADFQAAHGGMTAEQFSSALAGTSPAAGPTGANTFFITNAQQQLSAATKILGADDSYVQKVQSALDNEKSTPKDLWVATSQLQSQLSLQEKATAAAEQKAGLVQKQQATDPLFKYESDPKALADPGAQQALKAFIDDPANKSNFNDIARAQSLMTKANVAQQHEIDLAGRKASAVKTAEQAAAAGKPEEAGALLASGDLTLADLKSRGSTPGQIIAATKAAKAVDPKYNANDEVVGERIIGQPTNQVFFGSARSLVQRGGMLDQLKTAHDALGNVRLPAYNTFKDWRDYQAGEPQLATFRAAVLGSADDAAKVMGGGTPTDQLRDMFLQTFQNNINNIGFEGAIKQARDAVRSQVTGRIGTNRYVAKREGDILSDHQVGDTVTLKDGRQVVIKSLGTDGTFTY